jgi:hypothetical protein
MSESENFLARWSRLKREADLEVSGVGEHAPVDALQVAEEPSTPAFDPASLPAIESIDAATDIRPFLNACVPEELTRAALRSTWSADPAIRDFVGIAENQWDFNDPASIPGFGADAAADYVFDLATHTVGSLSAVVGTPAESSQMVERLVPESSGPAGSDPGDVACHVTAPVTDASHEADAASAAEDPSGAGSFTQRSASEGDLKTPMTRAHGGALPR